VPDHEGIVGNETADQLARTGSEHPFIRPEPACGISTGVAKKTARVWTNRNHNKKIRMRNWIQTGKGNYIRALCQKNEGSVKSNRDQLRWALRLFTGHCNIKGHLFKLGLTEYLTSERCLEKT
jgi:hypothetical protein